MKGSKFEVEILRNLELEMVSKNPTILLTLASCRTEIYPLLAQFLNQLNDAQRKAVEHTRGPVMVIAGAGSGKTRVLTYRVAYLLSKGVDAFNILSLTFTNKAAREMKKRIGKIVGESEAKNLWMGTFHSIFARILRIEAERLGYPTNFTIYDTDDSKKVVSKIIKEKNLDKDIYKGY